MKGWNAVAISLAALMLSACGGDEATKNNAAPNASTNNSTVNSNNQTVSDMGTQDQGEPPADVGPNDASADQASPADMSETADMGSDAGGPDMGPPTCDRDGFFTAVQLATWDPTNNYFIYAAYTIDPMMGNMPYEFMSFEIYPEFGGLVGPQQYTFTNQNYADCGTCVLIFADCMRQGGCQKIFLSEAGKVNVIAASTTDGAAFQAVFTDLVLRETTIDPATYMSTTVPGGETWCVDSFPANTTTEIVN